MSSPIKISPCGAHGDARFPQPCHVPYSFSSCPPTLQSKLLPLPLSCPSPSFFFWHPSMRLLSRCAHAIFRYYLFLFLFTSIFLIENFPLFYWFWYFPSAQCNSSYATTLEVLSVLKLIRFHLNYRFIMKPFFIILCLSLWFHQQLPASVFGSGSDYGS